MRRKQQLWILASTTNDCSNGSCDDKIFVLVFKVPTDILINMKPNFTVHDDEFIAKAFFEIFLNGTPICGFESINSLLGQAKWAQ